MGSKTIHSLVFSHGGDLGDCLYSIPAARIISDDKPFDLLLYPSNKVREAWTPAKVASLNALLETQPFIRSVQFVENPQGTILDRWRTHRPKKRLNIADHVCESFGLPHWERGKPWIAIESLPQGKDIICHRSPRYRCSTFPWGKLCDLYRIRMMFVGQPFEREDFAFHFGGIDYLETPTLLDLARAIKSSRLFIGNQSSPRALAEALAHPVYVEHPVHPFNTHFNRSNAWYGVADFEKVKRELSNK